MYERGRKLHMNTVKLVIALVLLAGAGVFGWSQWKERGRIVEENQATEAWNAGRFEQAADLYKALAAKYEAAGQADQAKARKDKVAECYRKLADPDAPLEQQAAALGKLEAYDPSALTGHEKGILKVAKGKAAKGAKAP